MSSKGTMLLKFHLPKDPKVLQLLGAVALRHTHLDYLLRMTIKTLLTDEATIAEVLDATATDGSAELRERVKKLAKQKLGEGVVLLRLQALLTRCKRATEKRNDLMHGIWAGESEGETMVQTKDQSWKSPPTIQELEAILEELALLARQINHARLHGSLAEALAEKKKKPEGLPT